MERILPEAPVQSRRPAVSVVMPVYNGERFLTAAIESILVQTFTDFELVVVDDGSTDSSAAILADLAEREPRLVHHRQSNQGSAAALNAGVDLATAPLIARLDADDLAMPDRLARQHRYLGENGEVGLVGGGAAIADENGRVFAEARYPTTDAEIREAFAGSTPFVHSAVMMRKEAFEKAGGYRPGFEPAEDIDLWLRIGEHHALANLDAIVATYRVHESQASAQKLEQQAIRSLAARVSARSRAAGRPDPFASGAPIDEAALLAQGTGADEIDDAVIRSAIWLAKTEDRAGYDKAAEDLFAIAFDRARSSSRPAELAATVRRALAQRQTERGRRVRARIESLRASLGEGFRRRRS